MLSDKNGGIRYVHPTNDHISVRVMPGLPDSPHPAQQKPYVVQLKDGKAFNKKGELVAPNTPEAHIPLEEFIYRD